MPTNQLLEIMMSIRASLLVAAALAVVACDAAAQSAHRYAPIAIPTRDGKSLAADLYFTDTTVAKPVILIQTPYNKDFYRLAINIPPEAGGAPFPYDSVHYNYVVLDWRGFFGSKDAAVQGYDYGLDGYDAVEWIAARAWCNGKVGTWGPSALGQVQYLTARQHPPHLVCAVPQVKDFKTKYTDSYYGGDFRQEHVESLEKLGLGSVSLILSQPTENIVWQVVERQNDYPESLAVPMLLISGWFDHYPDDIIRAFTDLRTRSAPAVRSAHKLIMGPWMHSGVGKAAQGELTFPNAAGVSDSAALRFFDYYIRGIENGYPDDPVVRYYQMGSNQWQTTSNWYSFCSAADTLTLYLTPNGRLSTDPPTGTGADSLRADPRAPSPTYGGARLAPFTPGAVEGPVDISDSVERRADALVYTTPVLSQDLMITGGVTVQLVLSTDRPDADVAVRLCDVYPDGRSIILTQGIKRMRFRKGLRPQDTAAMPIGGAVHVSVELQNIAMTFPAGHRLRIDVTGSNFPQYSINPNTGGELYKPGDSVVATSAIRLDPSDPSRVVMPGRLVPASAPSAAGNAGYVLGANVPNPFSQATAIPFTLPRSGPAVIAVYDALGRHVATLLDGPAEAGRHVVTWAPDDATPNGAYVCRLVAGGTARERELLLIR